MAHLITRRLMPLTAAVCSALLVTACKDVEYRYDIPQADADCPTGTVYRSGGSAIVDRSGGSAIVDRNSNQVMDYCYTPNCPGDTYDDTIPAEIDWHQDAHKQVIAKRTCLAVPPP